MRFEKYDNMYEIEGTPKEVKEILSFMNFDAQFNTNDKLKEVDKVSDKLQEVSNKLDYIMEALVLCEEGVLEKKIESLKQFDGEFWAIGEAIERILEVKGGWLDDHNLVHLNSVFHDIMNLLGIAVFNPDGKCRHIESVASEFDKKWRKFDKKTKKEVLDQFGLLENE